MKEKLLLSIFATILNALTSFAQIPTWLPNNGLVAWYPLTGNAVDSSGNGNNGTVYNSAPMTTDRFGKANAAYQFNGTNQYIGGDCSNFPAKARSVSLWYNGTSIGIGPPSGRCVFGYGGLNCGTSWIQVIASNRYNLSMHCGSNWSIFNFGVPIANNVWRHWMITSDGSSQTRFFLDGQLVYDTTNYYTNTYVAARNFTIGGIPSPTGYGNWTDGNVSPFQGKVDDVAIFNRALSDCEVRQIFYQSALAIGTQPANTSAPNGSKAVFSIKYSTDTCLTYQWQQDCGTGFVNLTDAGAYFGVSTDSLIINPVSLSMDNCVYRCIVSSCRYCSDTTNPATLKVTPVGITGLEFARPVSLFPNPFSDEINIFNEHGDVSEIVICDILSREILRRQFRTSISIDTRQFSKGIYIYELRDKNHVSKKGKILKE